MTRSLLAELEQELASSALPPRFVRACRRLLLLTRAEARALVSIVPDTIAVGDSLTNELASDLWRTPSPRIMAASDVLAKTFVLVANRCSVGRHQTGGRSDTDIAEEILWRTLIGFAAWDELDAIARDVLVAPFCIVTNFQP